MYTHKHKYLFTSESVSEGHPDKVADQISDAILDKLLQQDPNARVAVETLVKTGLVVIAGEVTTVGWVDCPEVVRAIIADIGYTEGAVGFDSISCGVLSAIEKQSPDIACGVNPDQGLYNKGEFGAGDQGMMFGYACDETDVYMPATIWYAHQILKTLSDIRKQKKVNWLRPDGKSQVTVEYENGKMKRIDTVVVSTQHTEEVTHKNIEEYVIEEVVKKVIPSDLLDSATKYYINPTGRFVIGGPQADCGITGRKIIVDTYGGHGAHGGGAFSGKDPTKVDRSAAYMARYIAKNLVAAGYAKKCLIQLAYAIGVPYPVSIYVNTYNTGIVSEEKIISVIKEVFRLTPKGIIETLDLLKPIYTKTAAYGHFGRDEFSWERLDKVHILRNML